MRLVYAPRALRDLRRIGAYYRSAADDKTAAAVGQRISHVINLIARQPYIAPRLRQRMEVHAASVLRYPSVIFYRVHAGEVEILHIRHTSRRPWGGEE